MLLVFSLLLLSTVGILLARVRRARRPGRRGYVSLHPAEASWLRGLGLCEPADFLNLAAVIVSGHPDRQVGHLTLDSRVVYLKRERRVRWTTRLMNFLSGHGWAARCVREAAVLEALERDNLHAPRWLAAGEDDRGRAFLLVADVRGAISLAAALAKEVTPMGRRQLAARVGAAVGRLHSAGFFHRDLYAKHVLVADNGICLLDWQRAWRGAWAPRVGRIRDLAALHATVPESLAGPAERLVCLRAYLEAAGLPATRSRMRCLIVEIDRIACAMRRRRHIREKRQRPTASTQAWICLDDEALCITPALADLTTGGSLDWLRLDRHPVGPTPVTRRWVTLAPGRRALLTHRRSSLPLVAWGRRLVLDRVAPSPEQRQATLLWRLDRHGVAAPGVLALGRRWVSGGRFESFLLTEPSAASVRLSTWLDRASHAQRAAILRQLGVLLARMHGACCYFEEGGLTGLAVATGGSSPRLVLHDVTRITPLRRPCATRAAQDLDEVRVLMRQGGCDLSLWPELLRGHAGEEPADGVPLPSLGLPVPAGEDLLPRSPTMIEGAAVDRPPRFWDRLVRGWRRLRQRPDWAFFAGPDWVGRIMDVSVTDQFHVKQGRSTGRWVLHASDGSGRQLPVFLKRHYKIPLWDGLRALLWPRGSWSPAMMEYDHLEWAREQGVPVPATVAAAEFLAPGARLQSFLAVEELVGMLPLHEAIPLAQAKMPEDLFRRWKRGLIVEIARISRLLHDRKHYHKDLYLCHFFIPATDTEAIPAGEVEGPCGAGWRNRVFLIDLHRLTHHPRTWIVWLLKDLAQLLFSSELPGIDTRDQLAFWMHYRGPGTQRWSYRLLRWLVLLKWSRYRAHNLRLQQRRKQGV